MKHIYITALLAVTLTACNDRPADATVTGAAKNDTAHTAPAADSPAAAPVKDMAPKEGEVLLRLNYPKGFSQELDYVVNTKGEAMTGTIGITMAYTVTDTVNKTYAFSGAITRIKMNSVSGGETINYDSAKKLPAKASQIEKGIDAQYKEVGGKTFIMAFSNKGEVVKEMQFAGNTSSALPFDMNTYQIQFPAEPVAVGANWAFKSAAKNGTTRVNGFTLKKITDNTVVIDVKSVLPPSENMKGAKESVFTGTYTLDRKTGMLLNGSLSGYVDTLDANVSMTFTGKKK